MKNKVILITGSSIGIGRETAFKFAKEGSIVIITYFKDKKEAEKAANKCLAIGASDVLAVELNLMNSKSISNCVKKVIDKFGKINVLINNAGIVVWRPLKEQSFEDIENQVRTNLEGMIKITRECLPYLKEAVINISSGAGKNGFRDLTAYCATKFGVRGFTQSLSDETNLNVVSVNPGTTATRMTNFVGISAEKVAQIILDVAKDKIKPDSNRDVDVWDYV